mgnify:CR=1 FL=1
MLIVNVGVLLTPDVAVENASIIIEGEFIREIKAGGERNIGAEIVECRECIAVPGFIDMHTHGYGGIDLNYVKSEKDLEKLSSMLVKHGVTTYLPTTVSCLLYTSPSPRDRG